MATEGSVDDCGPRPCSICKAVHVACDRQQPCGRCVRLGKAEFCQEAPLLKRGRKPRNNKITGNVGIGIGIGIGRSTRGTGSNTTQPVIPSPLTQRAVVVLDPHGRVVSATVEFCSLLGADLDELMGNECVVVPPPTAESPLPCALSSDVLNAWQLQPLPQPQQLVDTIWQSRKIADRTRAAAAGGRSVMLACHVKSFLGPNAQPLCTRLTVIKVDTPQESSSDENSFQSQLNQDHSESDSDDHHHHRYDDDDEYSEHYSEADANANEENNDDLQHVSSHSHKRHVSRQPMVQQNPKRRSSEESAGGSPHHVPIPLENSELQALQSGTAFASLTQVSWDPFRFE